MSETPATPLEQIVIETHSLPSIDTYPLPWAIERQDVTADEDASACIVDATGSIVVAVLDKEFIQCEITSARIARLIVLAVNSHDRLVAALRAIIYASDGCQGHAACNHSMEPWREARAVLTEINKP